MTQRATASAPSEKLVSDVDEIYTDLIDLYVAQTTNNRAALKDFRRHGLWVIQNIFEVLTLCPDPHYAVHITTGASPTPGWQFRYDGEGAENVVGALLEPRTNIPLEEVRVLEHDGRAHDPIAFVGSTAVKLELATQLPTVIADGGFVSIVPIRAPIALSLSA